MTTNYIDKDKLYQAFVKHKAKLTKARAEGKDDPALPNEVGMAIYQIAEGIARRPNFSGYSYIDEMILDGLENGLKAANNFDPDRGEKNPFGYFSKIIWWAFLRRIAKEQEENYVKYKLMEQMMISGQLYVADGQSIDSGVMDKIINDFESKQKPKVKKASKKKGVELLFPDDELDLDEIEIDEELDFIDKD